MLSYRNQTSAGQIGGAVIQEKTSSGKNTTQNLIEDMEELRQFLGIEKWVLFGGSWGSTLALYYSIKFPDRCLGLILRGVFLGTKQEIDWFLCDMGRFYPEAYKHFLKGLMVGRGGRTTTNLHDLNKHV